MNYVYKVYDDGHFEILSVPKDYVLQDNETFEKPDDGIYLPVHFKDGKIVSATEEEWKAYQAEINKDNPVNLPSSSDQMLAKLTMQSANQQKQIDDGNAMNAKLLTQVALLTQQLAAKGGN